MKKKFAAFILCVLCLLSAVGCGQAKTDEQTPPTDSFGRPFYHAILNIENGRAGLEPVVVPAPPPLRDARGGLRSMLSVMRHFQ